MAESEQTQVIQPKKKMGFGKKLIIILAVIVAFLGVCSLMIVHQNNQLEKKFYQVKSNKVVDNIRIVACRFAFKGIWQGQRKTCG